MIECQREAFSLPSNIHYLNCAYMSPLARRVEEAGIRGLRDKRNPASIGPGDFFETSDAVRAAFAKLVGTSHASRVSLAPSASYGIATAAKNLHLSPGSEIVALFEQFPSNIYTWRRLAAEKNLRLTVVSPPVESLDRGRIWNEHLLEAIGPDTSVVCLPTVHWTDGTRFGLEQIGERCRQTGAALIVDGTQSVGAIPFDVSTVQPDALICAGYKWLLGPYSVALCYWGPRFDEGSPLEENWIARKGSHDFAGLVDYEDAYQDGAIRYDVGERSNFILMPMMLEALMYVEELDPARIEAYCNVLTAGVLEETVDLGFKIETSEYRSPHLFGIRVPDSLPFDRLKTSLAHHNVSVSVRGNAIRVAPNVYNDGEDLSALLEALRSCRVESVR